MPSPRTPVLLLVAPYDSGVEDERMGAGPNRLAPDVVARLRAGGHHVVEQQLSPGPWRAELRTAFELHRAAAEAVAAKPHEYLPILVAGDCNTCLGLIAGLGSHEYRQGLVWLDAHGDFNTPATDRTGFLDGQGLAMAVGRCWQGALAAVPGFEPIPEHRALLVGARSLDPEEALALAASDIRVLPPELARSVHAVDEALDALGPAVDGVHLHIDLDVHDPATSPANEYSSPGGLTPAEVLRIVRAVAERLPIRSASLASYDPSCDPDGRTRDVALNLAQLLAQLGDP